MEKHLKTAVLLTKTLEHRFRIFGFEFGLDPLIGLFAGAGDILSALIGLYFVWIGVQIHVPSSKIFLMLWNLGIDFILGSIPLLGDIFDFAHKAHTKNLKILQEHYEGRLIQ